MAYKRCLPPGWVSKLPSVWCSSGPITSTHSLLAQLMRLCSLCSIIVDCYVSILVPVNHSCEINFIKFLNLPPMYTCPKTAKERSDCAAYKAAPKSQPPAAFLKICQRMEAYRWGRSWTCRFILDRYWHPWPTVPRNVRIVLLSFIRISTPTYTS